MVFNAARIWFLMTNKLGSAQSHSSSIMHLTVLQTEIGDATHGCSLALRQVFIDLIDAIGDMVVCLVEQFASARRLNDNDDRYKKKCTVGA